MALILAAVGKIASTPYADACQHYLKQFPRGFLTVQEIRHDKALLEVFQSARFRVALDERGKLLKSTQLAKQLAAWQGQSGDVTLFMGGADGLPDEIRQGADYTLSLTPMTLPHMLARVVLIEQLYRAQSILKGHPYHRV